jgi:hypothetical protein
MSAGIKGCRPQYLRFLTSRVTTRSVENRIFSCRSIPTGFFSQPEWRSGVSSFVLRSTPCGGTEAPCGFPGYPCPSLCSGVRYPSHPRSSGRHLAAQASLRFLLETSTALSFDNRRRLSRSSEGLPTKSPLRARWLAVRNPPGCLAGPQVNGNRSAAGSFQALPIHPASREDRLFGLQNLRLDVCQNPESLPVF